MTPEIICLSDLFFTLSVAKQNIWIFVLGVISGIALVLAIHFTLMMREKTLPC
jgi:hypothetical protein